MYRKKMKPTPTNILFMMLKIGSCALNPTLKLKLTKLKSASHRPEQQEKYDGEK